MIDDPGCIVIERRVASNNNIHERIDYATTKTIVVSALLHRECVAIPIDDYAIQASSLIRELFGWLYLKIGMDHAVPFLRGRLARRH
jgi:hypothetical protein